MPWNGSIFPATIQLRQMIDGPVRNPAIFHTMERPLPALVLLSSILSFVPSTFAAEKPWTEIRSPHFRVLTNGSTQDAVKVAREFEQLRWVFATRFPGWRLESGAPLLVLAVRDQATAKALDPQFRGFAGGHIGGLFHHGWEKQFAIVRLDAFVRDGSKEVVYHEYAHTILHMNSRWLPTWLDEGMAEFYAYTRFDENKVYLGAPTVRLRALHSAPLDSIDEIMAVTQRSALHHSEFFYAESWALVHFLVYGPGMEGGKKLDRFSTLLQQGVVQRKAFQQAFGEPKEIDKAFGLYTWGEAAPGDFSRVSKAFDVTVLKNTPQINEREFAIRTTSIAETEAELASYHLWIGDSQGARSLNEQAMRDDPKLGLAQENLGYLDLAEGKDAEASAEFAQAYALDNMLYLSLFAKTMMSPLSSSNAVPDMNSFGAALGKVLQINPQFAPAYAQLARLAFREHDFDAALLMSRKAEELEPSLAGYHLLSGQILLRMGKASDATDAARFVADRWVGSDHNEAVELWNSVPAERHPAGEMAFEGPKDTQVIEGKVKSVACADNDRDWALVLDQGGRFLTFHRKGGFDTGISDTIWYGADHFNMCHHLEGLRAIVYYHPAPDATYAGDIVAIEIRDDLPKPLQNP